MQSLKRYFQLQLRDRCEAIRKDAQTMPREHVSRNVDPSRVARLLANLRTVYTISLRFVVCTSTHEEMIRSYTDENRGKATYALRLAVDIWYSLMLPLKQTDANQRASLPQVAVSTNRTEENLHDLCMLVRENIASSRDILIKTLLESYDQLSLVYQVDGMQLCLSQLMFMTISAFDLLNVRFLAVPMRVQLERFRASDDDYLLSSNLVVATSPVCQYTDSEMYNALAQLCSEWNQLQYSERLLFYIDTLRIRVAQLVTLEDSGWVHDVERLRIYSPSNSTADSAAAINTTSCTYQSSLFCLCILTPTFRSVIEKLLQLRIARQMCTVPSANLTNSAVWVATKGVITDQAIGPARVAIFRQWIQDKLTDMYCDGASQYLRAHYLTMSMRPNEREMFSIANPTEIPTLHAVLKARGHEYNEICKQADRSIGDVFKSELKTSPEPLSFILVLTEFLDIYFKAFFSPIEWPTYVIFEKDIKERLSDLSTMDYPVILQCFNRMQLHFGDTVFWFDSYIHALLAWMFIVEVRFQRHVDGISLHKWYEELDETRRRHNLPREDAKKK